MATAAKEKKEKYIEGIGRRKTAIARVRIWPDKKEADFLVNEKKFEDYIKLSDLRSLASAPLSFLKTGSVSVKVGGGGFAAQAEAIRHGLARALAKMDESLRPQLAVRGWLRRDSRMTERKKYGLKKARRAPQFSKR